MNNVKFFEKELCQWFTKNGRVYLPWRQKGTTPYEIWVSEIMLQQTQVSRVIEYYKRFLKQFPTVFELAKSNWEEFYPYYAGLGYYNRGRNMLKCAQMIVEKYKGVFPATKEALTSLPGVGDYTASAILSFGYDENELAIDTNIKKVFGRYFLGSKNEKVDFDFFEKKLVSSKKQFNAAVMDFSNSVCLKIPRCGECPLRKYCEYFVTDGQKESVKKKENTKFPMKDASIHLILHKNHKEYYSTNKKDVKPFILSKKYNTREKIKEYFQQKYGLTLSVRPAHKKLYINTKPVILVNAQILLGRHTFYIFDKKNMEHSREIVSRESRVQAEIVRLTREGKWQKDAFKTVTVAIFNQDGDFVKFLSYDKNSASSRFGGPDDDDLSLLDSEMLVHPGFSFKEVH